MKIANGALFFLDMADAAPSESTEQDEELEFYDFFEALEDKIDSITEQSRLRSMGCALAACDDVSIVQLKSEKKNHDNNGIEQNGTSKRKSRN